MGNDEKITESIEKMREDECCELDIDGMCGIYKDIACNFGVSIALKMHKFYQGQQITFPTRIFSSEYLADMMIADYAAGATVKELSQKYGYSERRVRQIVNRQK